MKARVKKTDNQILLSIGMIVKNEEKHIENCMKALQPLRNQISSELIIVDTGSTDRTIEIAKKYADKFYTFEWCNDFSAARNYGMDRAEGKWFMFIDADEYFDENISEMVNFFKYPELYERYNSASYIIRNYIDDTKKYYSDFLGSRMVKRLPNVKFQDPIHEWLPMLTPHGYFGTIVHHFGYAYKNKTEKEKKSERNLKPLLEEYEQDKENSRTLSHLFDVCEVEDKKKYLDEWLEVCRKGKGSFYRNHCYKEYIAYVAYHEDYEKAKEIYDEYIKFDNFENSACTIQIYAMMALINYNHQKFKESYEFYEKYFDIYRRYHNNEIDISDLRCRPIKGINPCDYQEYIINAAHCLFTLERDEEALKLLSEIDIDNIDFMRFTKYSNIIISLSNNMKKYKYISDFYEKTIATGNIDKINITNKQMEECYLKNSDIQMNFARAIAKIKSDDTFVSIMRLVSEQNEKNISNDIQTLVNSIDNWGGGYSEIIYLAMKYKSDISKAIEKLSYEEIRSHFSLIAAAHDDYAEVALEYADINNFTNSIKQLFWLSSALETAVLSAKELDNDKKHDLYYIFISVISDYVLNIYNPELFNENDVEIMPPLHRFGYYMSCAMISINDGDKIGYIRNIKNALKHSEPMKDVVAFLLEEFETNLK